jgi:hypothetical protein
MRQDADWSFRGQYMLDRHGIRPVEANQALADPARIVLTPDPASKSGRSVRVIGWSETLSQLLTVIVLEHGGDLIGVNAWVSNPTDRGRYFSDGDAQ